MRFGWSLALPRYPVSLHPFDRLILHNGVVHTLDDAGTAVDESEAIDDDFATSKPADETDDEK